LLVNFHRWQFYFDTGCSHSSAEAVCCALCILISLSLHTVSILEMGRPSYVCTVCSEHFTRKYSANRHNHNIHNGAAEIVRLIEYLVGRSSGRYLASHPSWFRKQRGFQWDCSYDADEYNDEISILCSYIGY